MNAVHRRRNVHLVVFSSKEKNVVDVLSDFINLTQVHNSTVIAQDILPSVDFRHLP